MAFCDLRTAVAMPDGLAVSWLSTGSLCLNICLVRVLRDGRVEQLTAPALVCSNFGKVLLEHIRIHVKANPNIDMCTCSGMWIDIHGTLQSWLTPLV